MIAQAMPAEQCLFVECHDQVRSIAPVRDGAGADADLGECAAEDAAGEVGGDDLDLLDGLQAHLAARVHSARERILEERTGGEAARWHRAPAWRPHEPPATVRSSR